MRKDLIPYGSTNFCNLIDGLFEGSNDPFFRPIPFSFFKKYDLLSRTDIAEEENHFLYRIDLPGYDKKKISVKVSGSNLEITAQESEEDKDKQFTSRRDFKAVYSLPENIAEEGISAEYNNGVLLLTLPKIKPTAKPKPKEIEIK